MKFNFNIKDENIIKFYYILIHEKEMSLDEFMNELIEELWSLLLQEANVNDNEPLISYLQNALSSELDKENAIKYIKNYKGRG